MNVHDHFIRDLQDEMTFTESVIDDQPKNYQVRGIRAIKLVGAYVVHTLDSDQLRNIS